MPKHVAVTMMIRNCSWTQISNYFGIDESKILDSSWIFAFTLNTYQTKMKTSLKDRPMPLPFVAVHTIRNEMWKKTQQQRQDKRTNERPMQTISYTLHHIFMSMAMSMYMFMWESNCALNCKFFFNYWHWILNVQCTVWDYLFNRSIKQMKRSRWMQ